MIIYILSYEHLEHTRLTQTGRPQELLNMKVNIIIEYLLESWHNRCLNWV
jgi:hypothetical protein